MSCENAYWLFPKLSNPSPLCCSYCMLRWKTAHGQKLQQLWILVYPAWLCKQNKTHGCYDAFYSFILYCFCHCRESIMRLPSNFWGHDLADKCCKVKCISKTGSAEEIICIFNCKELKYCSGIISVDQGYLKFQILRCQIIIFTTSLAVAPELLKLHTTAIFENIETNLKKKKSVMLIWWQIALHKIFEI